MTSAMPGQRRGWSGLLRRSSFLSMERWRALVLALRGVTVFGAASVVTWFAMPSPIGSLAWIPSPAPALDGAYQMNDLLARATRRFDDDAGHIVGAEDIAFDAGGHAWSGLADGRIVRFDDAGVTTVVNTGGRPFGLQFSERDGLLYVCDADLGLLAVDPLKASVTVLANTAEGDGFRFTNNLEIDHKGRVYFTDSSSVWNKDQFTEDILDQRPTGRVLRYDPDSGETTVLVRELSSANGLALMPDERSLIIAETGRYRLWRLWLEGDQRNIKEPFIENLPGFPDNLSVSPRGTIWVAMASTRKRVLDAIHPSPFFKDAVATLPPRLRPQPVRWGFVLEVDAEGRALRSLQDPSGDVVASASAAHERNGVLWLGSVAERGLVTVTLP